MRRGTARVMVTIAVDDSAKNWFDNSLTKEQRNSIRDRIDSICDDLERWIAPIAEAVGR